MVKCPVCKEKTISTKWYVLDSYGTTTCPSCKSKLKQKSVLILLMYLPSLLGVPLFLDEIRNAEFLLPFVVICGWLLLVTIFILIKPQIKVID